MVPTVHEILTTPALGKVRHALVGLIDITTSPFVSAQVGVWVVVAVGRVKVRSIGVAPNSYVALVGVREGSLIVRYTMHA